MRFTSATRLKRRTHRIVFSILVILLIAIGPEPHAMAQQASARPNIVFIMADDLGYGDLRCFGQKLIKTPRLDQMADEGIKLTDFYAGCTVCAPSRCVLMTGKHMGHCHVRGNGAGIEQSLRDADVTVAEVLKKAGYATGMFGKWGLGDDIPNCEGLPNDQGFDVFFGYLNQVHAHNYYPAFLWSNKDKITLRNTVITLPRKYGGFAGGYASSRIDYSHDMIVEQAMKFVESNKSRPFFLYVPLTIPHANNEGTRGTGNGQEVPDYGIYKDKKWSDPDKGQAAMITRMDSDVGRLLDLLKKLKLDEQTLVMFTSDNGHHDEGGHNTETFDPNGPLRGMKRDLYEGGIRVPTIARWPGHIKPNSVSNHPAYFGDLMATSAEIAGATEHLPKNLDSISFLPTLMGQTKKQKQHEFLYWEFYERGSKQAVRSDQWKAIRMPMKTGPVQLYNLTKDLGEQNDLADQHPDLVKKLAAMMDQAHTPHPAWKPRGQPAKPR